MNNYEWLISRLDAFIRKYYANKVIRGSLVFLSCLLFYILTVSVGEYYLYLPVWSRILRGPSVAEDTALRPDRIRRHDNSAHES